MVSDRRRRHPHGAPRIRRVTLEFASVAVHDDFDIYE
jgi:hypothetical protein